MIQWLYSMDIIIFKWINQIAVHPWLDSFFVTLTLLHKNEFFLKMLLPSILILWFWFERRRMIRAVVCLVISVAITDNISHRVIKPIYKRSRPHHITTLTQADLKLDYSPSGYSFPSNHAANNFAGATVLSGFYPHLAIVFFGFAALVAYSRPYVGVHYFSDIIAGGFLGFFIGYLFNFYIFRRFSHRERK